MSENKTKEAVIKQIMLKNRTDPYFVNHSIYDMNINFDFPSSQWYKGRALSSEPLVADREAGWNPKNTYKPKDVKTNTDSEELNHRICFQSPCSVVYPCYVQDNYYTTLNKVCPINYR